jgi:transposase InsO family protein
VDARIKFIQEYSSGTWTVDELARRHGISHKTAYKFLGRFAHEGVAGLVDRSRARPHQDQRTPAALERRIVALKRRYPYWGPRKLLALLERRDPATDWPAKSTIGDILKRHDLVSARRSRRVTAPSSASPLRPPSEPNDLWCTDFKGYRLSGMSHRLEPFTLGDAFSRYSLACKLVESTSTRNVWPILEQAFREYGLPGRIRSDNGTPFASPAPAGLSRLSVKLLRLGIRPERIAPGKPQQNGMLERFHLTLELEAMSPPARTPRLQERALDRFRHRFNHVRPHEALGDRTPADIYVPSPRRLPRRVPPFEYERYVPVRVVRADGAVRWAGRDIYLSETLVGERVGFQQSSDTHWSIRLGPLEVALFDEASRVILCHKRLVWVDEPDPA